MTPQIDRLGKNSPCSQGFNTHLWCFQGHRWENMNFSTKLRHVTPQIDCLGETSSVLRVSTHIFGGFSGDRWENIHFESKPRHVTPQIDCLGQTSTVLRVWIHIYGVSKEIDGKTCTLNLQLLHNTKRPTKWSGHAKMIDLPRELLHMKDLLPERVTI